MDSTAHTALARVVAEVEAERTTSEVGGGAYQTLRERARNVDRSQRMIAMALGQVYTLPPSEVYDHLLTTSACFAELRTAIAEVAEAVPPNEYYKWNETWSYAMRNAAYDVCFAYFLGTGALLSKEDTASVLGMDALASHRMSLATDEYLHGLISMVNELPRLALNAVTAGDFGAPVGIAAFVKQLHAAFQVLNLKNDILRKRFDGLKVGALLTQYDVKRVEEILYDIRLRGLVAEDTPAAHDADRRTLLDRMQGTR